MEHTDNRFTGRQLVRASEAERDVIRLYAASCFLNIQILHGALHLLDRAETLADALAVAEARLQRTLAALARTGVDSGAVPALDEQERLQLFRAHFSGPGDSHGEIESLFDSDDFRQMLSDISRLPDAGVS